MAEEKDSGIAKEVKDPWHILRFVLMTEKCVRQIESENQLAFVARRDATKGEIAGAFEQVFKARVKRVRTLVDQKGRKKAYIKLAESGQASEIAIKLGII